MLVCITRDHGLTPVKIVKSITCAALSSFAFLTNQQQVTLQEVCLFSHTLNELHVLAIMSWGAFTQHLFRGLKGALTWRNQGTPSPLKMHVLTQLW